MNYTCQKCGGPLLADLTLECPACFPSAYIGWIAISGLTVNGVWYPYLGFSCAFPSPAGQPDMPDQHAEPEDEDDER